MKAYLSLALLLILVCVGAGQPKRSPEWLSLVEAERSFASTSVEKGVRESFLMFFAEDGINFTPHPTKTREAFLKRPAPATRPPIELNWAPVYADISRAGDLGYTTGPYTLTDKSPQKQPTRYGFYFSIWRKQVDGSWKVVVDCGIDTPDHSKQTFVLKAAPELPYRSQKTLPTVEATREDLLLLDRNFLKLVQSDGLAKGYLRLLSSEPRLHRDGEFPILGREAIRTYLAKQNVQFTWQPIKSDAAYSNDLGYTYGSYEMKSGNTTEKGYYVRVWRRADRDWQLALETLSPIPPDSK